MSEKISGIINSQSAPEPVGAYPHARKVGEFLFLSGVGPRQKGTDVIPGVSPHDIAIQTQAVIDNVGMILEASGSSLQNVVDIQVFLTNMQRDFQGFNQVYNKTFQDIGPTRTTIEVGSLPTPIAVEFKVIALA
ncbi:MAG: RidA family protein [Deltaproteobacteria bacterium]|nr:RidA family protein [Deltaproteobacteria bacterium]